MPIIGFDLKVESSQGSGDDTATNMIGILYFNGDARLVAHVGTWGNWGAAVKCPVGQAICGLRTQVEDYQGV